jgi:transcriptional antiterminator NusG
MAVVEPWDEVEPAFDADEGERSYDDADLSDDVEEGASPFGEPEVDESAVPERGRRASGRAPRPLFDPTVVAVLAPEEPAVASAVVEQAVERAEEVEEQPPEALSPAVAEPSEAPAATGEGTADVAPEPDDKRAWYVVHCYSGYEAKVKHNLEQRIETMGMQGQIFQVVVPTEDEIEVHEGRRRVVERRVFPGYILVQMILTDDSWLVVRNTPGVTGFVGMGNQPTPLRPEEVQAILKRMEAEAPKVKVTFKRNQKVRIIDGPFNEFIGVVEDIDMDRAKVRVLVSFFGRETPVELDFLQVEKV